jgi:hypothetical protein
LFKKDSILFLQILVDSLLLAVDPAGDRTTSPPGRYAPAAKVGDIPDTPGRDIKLRRREGKVPFLGGDTAPHI